MLTRIPLAILLLAALSVCATSLAVESDPAGMNPSGIKVEESTAGSEVAAPATTEWGMMVMVLLVLTSTTAAMLGGGFTGSVERVRRTPFRPSPAQEPREESPSPKAAASPKNKSKRPFSYRRVFRSHGHQDSGHGGRRNSAQRTRRRREGPGCRGIR